MKATASRSCPASLAASPNSSERPSSRIQVPHQDQGLEVFVERSKSAPETTLLKGSYGARGYHRMDSASDRPPESEASASRTVSSEATSDPATNPAGPSVSTPPDSEAAAALETAEAEDTFDAALAAGSAAPPGGGGQPPRGRRHLSRSDSAQREEVPQNMLPFPGPTKERSPGLFRDSYRVLNSIGSGAFSRVRVVQERRPVAPDGERRVWACKTLSMPPAGAEAVDGQSSWEEVMNEIQVMSRLQHPCIVHFHEYFVEGSTVHIIMELLRGGELLHAVVDRGSLVEEDARIIMTKLLDTLRYLHGLGLAHRDLKLENLLIADEDDVTSIKIADFGLAKWSNGNPMQTICGTPLYLAPEVLTVTGIREPNLRISQYGMGCDIWACGVILYIMLSGHPPFHNDSLPLMFESIRNAEYNFHDPAWVMVTDEARDLVVTMLTKDPLLRTTPEEALVHPWIMGDLASLGISR